MFDSQARARAQVVADERGEPVRFRDYGLLGSLSGGDRVTLNDPKWKHGDLLVPKWNKYRLLYVRRGDVYMSDAIVPYSSEEEPEVTEGKRVDFDVLDDFLEKSESSLTSVLCGANVLEGLYRVAQSVDREDVRDKDGYSRQDAVLRRLQAVERMGLRVSKLVDLLAVLDATFVTPSQLGEMSSVRDWAGAFGFPMSVEGFAKLVQVVDLLHALDVDARMMHDQWYNRAELETLIVQKSKYTGHQSATSVFRAGEALSAVDVLLHGFDPQCQAEAIASGMVARYEPVKNGVVPIDGYVLVKCEVSQPFSFSPGTRVSLLLDSRSGLLGSGTVPGRVTEVGLGSAGEMLAVVEVGERAPVGPGVMARTPYISTYHSPRRSSSDRTWDTSERVEGRDVPFDVVIATAVDSDD